MHLERVQSKSSGLRNGTGNESKADFQSQILHHPPHAIVAYFLPLLQLLLHYDFPET